MNGDSSSRFCSELIGGLADAGVTTAFVSPGSRNTPLTLAVAADPRIADVNVRDERSAGFMALGHGKATGHPAVVICTSGSASTHYYPAVVEADQSSTPLIVLTADRPLRLRGTSAPQTMDQTDLFGSHVKYFVDATETSVDGRALGIDLAAQSVRGQAGPIHANLPFDEPLLPSAPIDAPRPRPVDRIANEPHASTGILEQLSSMQTLIVAGGRQPAGFAEALAAVAATLGAPIVADPQTPVHGPNVIGNGDLLVAAHDDGGRRLVLAELEPEAILRLGPLPTSKPLWEWFGTFPGLQVHVDDARLADPFAARTTQVAASPAAFLSGEALPVVPTTSAYLDRWVSLDQLAEEALRSSIAALPFPNEPAIAAIVGSRVPSETVLFVASSRPIRDVDAFAGRRPDVTVIANRGVNGIDGTISTALGVASAGHAVTLLIGDIAALHDATALSEAAAQRAPLRIVVVNNDGGGIFEFLPQARSALVSPEVFERHWGTPHGLSLTSIAVAQGMRAREVEDASDLGQAVGAEIDGPELLEIRTDRARVVDDHATIRRAIADALRGSDEVE